MRPEIRFLIVPAAVIASAVGIATIGWQMGGAPQRSASLSAVVPVEATRSADPQPAPAEVVIEEPTDLPVARDEAPVPQLAALPGDGGGEPHVADMEAEDIVLPEPEPPPQLVEVPPPEAAVVPAPQPGPLVHLASYYGPRMARAGWAVLTGSAGNLLADAEPELRNVHVLGRSYVRLLARLPEGADAAGRCAELRRAGFYCAPSSQTARSAKAR